MKFALSIMLTSLALLLLSAKLVFADAIEYHDFKGVKCIPNDVPVFDETASGIGSSCALVGRKTTAENRAIDALEHDGQNKCEDIRDGNPDVWDVLCLELCKFNGYEESTGTGMCSYEVTDTDTWEEGGCLFGNKQYHQSEATVQCGCTCSKDL